MTEPSKEQQEVEYLREQLAQIDVAREALSTMKDELLDRHNHIVRGECADCGVPLFAGDKGFPCLDGDPVFCAAHAYTWANVKAQFVENPDDYDADTTASFYAGLQRHIDGGGSVEDKVLHVL